jgi:hypothetical protein
MTINIGFLLDMMVDANRERKVRWSQIVTTFMPLSFQRHFPSLSLNIALSRNVGRSDFGISRF